jgi:hypothetical protein
VDITSLEQKAIDFARRGEFGAEAKGVNEELTRLAPANQGAWTRLARCNIELGLLDAASEALEKVLQVNPQNTIARSLLQEAIRRQVLLLPEEPRPKRTTTRTPRTARPATSARPRARGAFGSAQFAALGQLAPASALESLGATMEALLMALNERPFAAKVVEARNRAGRAGNRLFRRNTIVAGPPGHLSASHHGGRWEPQLNIGVLAAAQWGRSSMRAGIGFNLAPDGSAPDREDGPEALAESFDRFQQLVASTWRGLLTEWMAASGGFIQYGEGGPALELLPKDAVEWLINVQDARTHGWVFVGRWLFADRPEHAATLEDAGALTKWADGVFSDLLPLWMSVYRGA